MPEADLGTSAGQTTGSSQAEVTNQLSTLVPSFDPAVDSVEIFSNKVTLLLAAWPQGTFPSLINPEAARCGETVAVGYISFFVCCFTFQATLA